MEPSLSSILASKTRRARKYAAKFRLADHAGARQRLYLRFLCMKRAVWSGVPEFAAYFRFENSEMREKPKSVVQTLVLCFATCGFVIRIWFVLGWFRFFPALPEIGCFGLDI